MKKMIATFFALTTLATAIAAPMAEARHRTGCYYGYTWVCQDRPT